MQPDAAREAIGFVPVRVDSDAREDLVRDWQIRELPTFVFRSPEGGLLGRLDGPIRDVGELAQALARARETLGQFRRLRDRSAKRPEDGKLRLQLGRQYLALQLWEASAREFEAAAALDPDGRAETGEVLAECRVYADLMRGRHEEGAAHARRFQERWPDSKGLARVLYWRGLCLYRLGHREEAIAVWQEVVDRFPTDPTVRQAEEALTRARTDSK